MTHNKRRQRRRRLRRWQRIRSTCWFLIEKRACTDLSAYTVYANIDYGSPHPVELSMHRRAAQKQLRQLPQIMRRAFFSLNDSLKASKLLLFLTQCKLPMPAGNQTTISPNTYAMRSAVYVCVCVLCECAHIIRIII